MVLKFLSGIKKILLPVLMSIFLFGSISHARVAYDNFSGSLLDDQKWAEPEKVREVYNGALIQKIANMPGSEYCRVSTCFFDPSTINSFESNITIVSTTNSDSTGSDKESAARLGGIFYNTQSTGAGATGDVWAAVKIGNRGSGLEAWWEIQESDDDTMDNENYTVIGSGNLIAPGTLLYGVAYNSKISYDNVNNNFIFEVNSVSYTFTTPPARQRDPITIHKALSASAYGTTGNAYTSVLFDDVKTNSTSYDDFSTSPLDQTKWSDQEEVREIFNGKARLNVQANGATNQTTLYFPNNNLNYIEAKCLTESGSVVSSGATGIIRVAGYYYNETGAPYNGYQNDVWADLRITLDENNFMIANCSLWRWDTEYESGAGTYLFGQQFSTPINFDTEYILSVERIGQQFIFKVNNEIISYNVATTMHEPSTGQHRQIRSRVYADPGETGYMKTTVDDVYTDKENIYKDVFYDKFPGPLLDEQKWIDCESVRETVSGKLKIKVANKPSRVFSRVSTSFFDPSTIHTIESNITVMSATSLDSTGSGDERECAGRLDGYFYNTQSSGGATGDIWAGVKIGNRGSGIEAWWEVYEAMDDNRSNMQEVGTGTLIAPGPLSFDTSYHAKLFYDNGNNEFTFEVNSVSYTFTTPPARQRYPVTNYKGLSASAYGTTGNGYTYVTFDNAKINGTTHDDFSTSPLDQTKWSSRELVREIVSGKARLNIQAHGALANNTLNFPDQTFNYLEAKCLVESGSIISTDASGIVRIAGYYYNETGAPYDGNKNDVWVDNRITLEDDNTLHALCRLFRNDTSDPYGPGTTLFQQSYATPLSLDTEYLLSIERKGTKFIFKLNSESYSYDVTSSMHDPSEGQLRQIRSRVYSDPGESGYMKTTIDNVKIKKGINLIPITSLLLLNN